MPDLTPERVLLLTDRYPPQAGGLARASQRLAQHAAANGAAVHVLLLRGDGPPGSVDSAREGDLWVHRLGAERGAADAGQQAAFVIEWLHARERFDLLHGQYASTGGFLAAYHARLMGIAGYVSLRGNDLDRDVYEPGRFAQLTWALQHAHAVGAVSTALARSAGQLAGRTDVRFTPNSVDGELFHPTRPDAAFRERLGLGEGPVVGFVGELRHKKGAQFVLDAFRHVASAHPVQLVIAGTIRTEERLLLERFLEDEPDLAPRVRLCSYLHAPEELNALYNSLDVLLSPSLWEGMPNAVLEAMACGRPVLASDAGGIPDLLIPGETGWMLPRTELHHLGEALREVLDLPEAARAAIGLRAREHVLRRFPPERERRELAEAYAAALSSAR